MSVSIDLNQLVEAVGDAIVVCDASGAITLWNPAAERMFGFLATTGPRGERRSTRSLFPPS